MSSTLLRLGLYTILIVVVLYVLRETYEQSPVTEFIPAAMMQKVLALGGILVVVGVVTRVFEKGAKAVSKNRCSVCKTPIPAGAIYCRAHLRRILHAEDDRTHMTRTRRQ